MGRLRVHAWHGLLSLGLVACSEGTVVGSGGYAAPDGGYGGSGGGGGLPDGAVVVPGGKSVGEACEGDGECRPGLACTSGACAFSHSVAEGNPCVAAGECAAGLQCARGVCTSPGADAGAEGDSCTADVSDELGNVGCQAGLRCAIVGLAAQCVPEGTSDVGASCGVSADCYAGLICAPGMTPDGGAGAPACAPIPPVGGVPFGIPTAPKLACDPVSADTVTSYFELPGAAGSSADADFFRSPFPSDARMTAGKVDLTGFPTPGSSLLGFDPVKVYVDALQANETGWGTSPTVIFRFSGVIDFDSFRAQAGVDSPVQYLDITDPTAPGNGGASWAYQHDGGKYLCHDWFAVRRPKGNPLEPGHTYAVYLTTSGKDQNGHAIERSPQLASLLADAVPTDAKLAAAHAAFAPFRAYLKAQNIASTTVLNAAVFTTSPVRDTMKTLAASAMAAPAPVATGWVKCGGAAASPCPQATGDRACGAASADYDEYHALVTVPVFQKGEAPYLASGGDVDPTTAVRSEDVCVSLTVPKGQAPATGWPVAVFAHGTGGSFRSHVRPEVAGALAKASTKLAVLGYDQVQHGPRRGTSTASPNVLFFNFKNPAAARGNPLQGAADVVTMGRFAKAIVVPASVSGGADVTTDPAAVVFFGHSQGSMHGSLGLPYTNDYSAAVLSGNGASLMHALLTKTAPQNIAAAVPFALGGDYDSKRRLFGGDSHPVLTLLQQWIDPADPLNFARTISREPEDGVVPKSVFATYGLGDTYSPPVTMQQYIITANMALAAHDPSVATPDDIAGIAETAVPVADTFVSDGGKSITLAARQYQNAAGKDGHFVVFDVPSANADAVRFLSMAAAGEIPAVGN